MYGKFSLKYSDNVPEDYDISKMQFTFDFINLVFKRNASIDDAVKDVAYKYDLSEKYLKDYLVENKYILNKTTKKELSVQVNKYNTKSLKKILKKHGIKTSGKREKIEQRIVDNGLVGVNYNLSSKSRIFYKNKKRRINIFNDYLSENYYFDEFNDFYMDNFRKKEAKIPVEFIKLHIFKSIEDKSHESYIVNTNIMANYFYIKKNCKSTLEYVLKSFCMNLNPVFKIGDLKDHVGVDIETYDNLVFLYKKIGKNRIIQAYYVVWDSFNFDKLIVSKFDGYRCLKDILHLKDYNRIVGNLNDKFYSNDDLKIKRITQKTLFDF